MNNPLFKPQAIILDRDGVVNEVVIKEGKISSPHLPEEFVIRRDFSHFCAFLFHLQVPVFVASNQPDVKRGLMSEMALAAMTKQLCGEYPIIQEVLYCLHDDIDACACRKPKPGLLQALIEEHRLAKETTLFIGDSLKDVLAGQSAGLKTVFLRKNYNQASLQLCQPDIIVSELMELTSMFTSKEGTHV